MRKSPDPPVRKPISLPVIYILLALADGDSHGYAIKQDVEERTGGSIRLGPGTLYEAIQRLEQTGLISERGIHSATAVNGQAAQRRYYSLTDRGWTALQAEIRQLDQVIAHARRNPRLRKGLA